MGNLGQQQNGELVALHYPILLDDGAEEMAVLTLSAR